MKTLKLKRGKEDSLLRFHPWVFSGALVSMPDDVAEGEVVRVVAHDGTTMGLGHFQIGSIAVRMLTFGEQPVDDALIRSRLNDALRQF